MWNWAFHRRTIILSTCENDHVWIELPDTSTPWLSVAAIPSCFLLFPSGAKSYLSCSQTPKHKLHSSYHSSAGLLGACSSARGVPGPTMLPCWTRPDDWKLYGPNPNTQELPCSFRAPLALCGAAALFTLGSGWSPAASRRGQLCSRVRVRGRGLFPNRSGLSPVQWGNTTNSRNTAEKREEGIVSLDAATPGRRIPQDSRPSNEAIPGSRDPRWRQHSAEYSCSAS